jgi:hypothetical protein
VTCTSLLRVFFLDRVFGPSRHTLGAGKGHGMILIIGKELESGERNSVVLMNGLTARPFRRYVARLLLILEVVFLV